MYQGLSWECNGHQEISFLVRNPEVDICVHKARLLFVSWATWIQPVLQFLFDLSRRTVGNSGAVAEECIMSSKASALI
jgi:hypothetical protein